MESILGKTIKDILDIFKSKYCVECSNSLEDVSKDTNSINVPLFISMPSCRCTICSKHCLDSYLKRVLYNSERTCLCGESFSVKDAVEICKMMATMKLESEYIFVRNYIKLTFKSICFTCLNHFDLYDEVFHRVHFESEQLSKFLGDKKFSHIICGKCYDSSNLKEKTEVQCNFCQEPHLIVKIKKRVNNDNSESDCIIY